MTDNELLSNVVTYLNGCRNNAHCGTVAYEQFSNWISAIQQAASVVKCMDCKYGWLIQGTPFVLCQKPYGGSLKHNIDYYCADGKRRPSGNELPKSD